MALASYDGYTDPYIVNADSGLSVINIGDGSPVNGTWSYVQPNDVIVVSGTQTVTTDQSANFGIGPVGNAVTVGKPIGCSVSRAASFTFSDGATTYCIYIIKFDNTFTPGPINGIFIIGANVVGICSLIRNVGSVDTSYAMAGSTATVAAYGLFSATSSIPSQSNALVLVGEGLNTAQSTPTNAYYTPSSEYQLGYSNGSGQTFSAKLDANLIDGNGTAVTRQVSYSAATQWAMGFVLLYGPTVSLDDLTYRLGENGTLLNTPSSNSVPIYDITSITGLTDTTATYDSSAIDGQDGSYVASKFLTGKSIVLTGTLYGSSVFNESLIDQLKLEYRPSDKPSPFFFAPSNNLKPRRLMVYPTGVKSDIDRSRTLSAVPFQVSVLSADAYAYTPTKLATQSALGVSNSISITPDGNSYSFPRIYFYFSGYTYMGSGIGSLYFFNYTWSSYFGKQIDKQSVGVNTASGLSVGQYMLDLKARQLFKLVNGVWTDYSSILNTRNWFGLIPNVVNRIGWNPTNVGAGFSIAYEGAYL